MEVTRTATTVWEGNLADGTGEVNSLTSQHLRNLPVTWAARTEDPQGRTSPEELLAAAHSACFAMSFSSRLTKAGHPPERLDVRADVSFTKGDDGWRVSRSELKVKARVPGVDPSTFQQAAEAARDGCPISQALKGNVELSVEASLEG